MFSDFPGLTVPETADVQFFRLAHESNAYVAYVPWNRPRGKSMCEIICVGGAGGGAGGASGSGTLNGGGGGGTGAIARLATSIWSLPDVMYICTGRGGAGGAAATDGGNGSQSVVLSAPDNNNRSGIILKSGGNTNAQGGLASGSGGAAESARLVTDCPFASFGIANFVAGRAGTTGGPGTNGTGTVIANTHCLTPGTGGGGQLVATNNTGGQMVAGGIFPGYTGGAIAGGDGRGGMQLWRPFVSYGGCGGGSNFAGTGGRGGGGAFGSGGGGGGSGVTGGAGGDGGMGFVLIICW